MGTPSVKRRVTQDTGINSAIIIVIILNMWHEESLEYYKQSKMGASVRTQKQNANRNVDSKVSVYEVSE